MKLPLAKRIPKILECHNHQRTDDFFWLRERENPAVISYLESENSYTEHVLHDHKKLREDLYKEMRARIVEDDSSVPYFFNGYWYYTRYEKGAEYAIYCRKKKTLEATEEILLDENELAKGHAYYEVVSFTISQDNNTLAFTEDTTGRRLYGIRKRNLVTGEFSDTGLTNCGSDLVLSDNGDMLYFSVKHSETLRTFEIKSIEFSTKKIEDVFTETDETFACNISKSADLSTIFIGSHSTLTTEYRFKSAKNTGAFEIFLPRKRGHEYYPESHLDKFYIKTNFEATNFKMVWCSRENREPSAWQEFQAHDKDIFVEDFEAFKETIVIQEKVNGLTQLRVYDLKSGKNKIIPPKEETFTLYFGTNVEFDANFVRIGYSSMTTPHTVYDIDLKTFEWTLKKQTKILGDFDSVNYKSERVWATAEDGTKIPASLVYRKDCFKKDGSNPALLYGYGAYGSTIDPYFSSVRLSLLDRGFVFVIAHIRGGEYLGRKWYEDGKLLRKKNSFTDFIAVGDFLIAQKYCDKQKLFAMGGSAGGLLMGAIANIRPDLWKGIVSQVPFLDVITTMLDETIPLTTGEYDEWGDPRKKEFYDYILSYSPYDQLKSGNYPAMLITAGLHDSQVQYWEPAKYVAKLRGLKTDKNPLLLFTNMDAGHGGASGRFEQLKEIALEYAFILAINSNELRSE